jgi:hypothetical protein
MDYQYFLSNSFKSNFRSQVKRELMAKKKCDHLNVETMAVSGISMAVCKDCGGKVDPEAFETKVEASNTAVPMPTPAPADRPTDDMTRVYDTLVSDLISIPGLEKPFFPLFGVKSGDLVVVLRHKG